MDVDIIELNNAEYIIFETIIDEDNNNKYLFLANRIDNEDILIRKVITKEDGKEYIVKLDNDFEFEKATILFNEKHKGERENEE